MGKNNRGFTLVELIVVITIIGILAGFGFTNYVTSQKRARDGRRKADLEQIRSALEMYRADAGVYPTTGNLSALQTAGYIEIPTDPLPGRNYFYASDGTTYELCAALEIPGPDTCSGPCGVACNYKTKNP